MNAALVLCVGCSAAAGYGGAWFFMGGAGRHRSRRAQSSTVVSALLSPLLAETRRRQEERRRERSATLDMPTFLDIVTLGISAGLSFDASLELYCERYDTPLARMVSDAMLSWRMGIRGRGEALQELAREVESPAMARFTAAVVDALAFGTPLAESLERQAQVIRDEQRAQVEEEIERVPVRMLIPLGTLIVPAMLISILGPLLGPALSMA
ncbi:MAG: type II secretion system F family protein [Atopobiaceae bacterium]|nr:type II secretion system F family protein [Atopobiaceae bacterium]